MLTEKTIALDTKAGNYLVAIGASAGGLEAINELFENIPDNTNFTFVVIQHLSPDHKSLMAELLSKHTSLPVIEAKNGMVPQPNHIYLLPSKKTMTIETGKFKLEEKKDHIPNYSIDIFFESLAKEKKNNAVAIILSGTGTDGTKGIECIKKHGGVVVVQDPLTAAFNGMPNSAVATGFADLILPPEMIPYELIEYLNEAPLIKTFNELNNQEEAILADIINLIHESTSYDFRYYKRPTISRRLAKRMTLKNFTSLAAYFDYLKNDQEEIRALCKEFIINVTRFFRDEDAFNIIKSHVIPSLFAQKHPDDIIKVWVAGCSTGEEAYSIAILFQEYIEKHKKYDISVKIFATDIDEEAITVASRAAYSVNIREDVSSERLSHFFILENNAYHPIPSIRKMVVFAKHDVVKDPPYGKLDLVTCRNLLIYMEPLLQKNVLHKFHFALNEGGFLFLGSSENTGILKDALKEIDKKWKIYQCIKKSSVPAYDSFVNPLHKTNLPQRNISNAKNALSHLSEIFKETLIEEQEYAGILIDKNFDVKQATGKFKRFLHFPEGNFNFNLLKMVSPDLAVALSTCLRKALKENEKVAAKKIKIQEGNTTRFINIVVKPYLDQQKYLQPFIFVILHNDGEEKKRSIINKKEPDLHSGYRIEELENELKTTKENLQATIEELESTNEELQSSNEEIISANEELQSTNEELQSLNEELHTVNAEHQLKIKELIELNDDLDNYFRNSEIGQILVDRNLIIKKFTPTVTKQVNLIETDIGRSITDISVNFKNDFVPEIKNVLRSHTPVEKEIMTSDGNIFLMRITPYIRQDKTTDGVVVNFIDITEVKRLSSLTEAIFNSSTSAIVAQKPLRNEEGIIVDFEIIRANDTTKKIFGISPAKIVGQPMKKYFPVLIGDHIDKLTDVIKTGEVKHFEYFRSIQNLWIEVIIVKMLDGLIITFNDVTEKKASADLLEQQYQEIKNTSEKLMTTNQKLEQSNYDLLQFASVASHDLKEPLRKIEAYGNLLMHKIENKLDETEKKHLDKIIKSSGRMQSLIEDILTLSKLSNRVAQSEVDLNEIIQNLLEDLEVSIKEKNVDIQSDRLPQIKAVPGQMHQLFQNLITNAIKFNDSKNPKIFIRLQNPTSQLQEQLILRNEDHICITVEDNGIGFEPQYSEKIFGIFQRLDGRQYEGTGIGLAICKKIMENHQGIIKADSAPGKGSIFTMIFPVKDKHC